MFEKILRTKKLSFQSKHSHGCWSNWKGKFDNRNHRTIFTRCKNFQHFNAKIIINYKWKWKGPKKLGLTTLLFDRISKRIFFIPNRFRLSLVFPLNPIDTIMYSDCLERIIRSIESMHRKYSPRVNWRRDLRIPIEKNINNSLFFFMKKKTNVVVIQSIIS